MRSKLIGLLSVFLTLVMLLTTSLQVHAAQSNAVSQDGLTAQMFTDKDSYQANE